MCWPTYIRHFEGRHIGTQTQTYIIDKIEYEKL